MAQPEQYPYYKIHDKEGSSDGRYKVYTILIDSDDGRAYEKLSTHTERLEYMRKHAHDSWNVVQTDSTFLEDNLAGKTYTIKINSPEYEGLKKFLREDGSSWPPGTKEFDDMARYYREHATSVEDAPKGISRVMQCCCCQ
ncbi:hypothetical protein F4781DRAFT_131141 [Annulohypoxylon bovei var. microspora]|nr:hypothetical protein F4781DRAFT_131141 [Annulohypoxylon bovei var. microspora]